MKRDWDLIRKILVFLENIETFRGWKEVTIDNIDSIHVDYHLKLLFEAGLIEAIDLSSKQEIKWRAICLTWKGHDFLDAIRNDNVWNKVKKQIQSKGVTVTFDILYTLLTRCLNDVLNLH